MIAVNIRGTGGSGKSTVVRRVMSAYGSRQPVMSTGRRQPLGYELEVEGRPPLFVPGHYETACGGCDTIKTPDEVYDLVRARLRLGWDVVYEGIMIMDDVRRAVDLSQAHKLVVIALTTPIDVCLRSIEERRAEAARAQGREPKPLDPKNTRSRAERQEKILRRLQDAGVAVERHDREAAYNRIMELLA